MGKVKKEKKNLINKYKCLNELIIYKRYLILL
jgi:hypothetical protein